MYFIYGEAHGFQYIWFNFFPLNIGCIIIKIKCSFLLSKDEVIFIALLDQINFVLVH